MYICVVYKKALQPEWQTFAWALWTKSMLFGSDRVRSRGEGVPGTTAGSRDPQLLGWLCLGFPSSKCSTWSIRFCRLQQNWLRQSQFLSPLCTRLYSANYTHLAYRLTVIGCWNSTFAPIRYSFPPLSASLSMQTWMLRRCQPYNIYSRYPPSFNSYSYLQQINNQIPVCQN